MILNIKLIIIHQRKINCLKNIEPNIEQLILEYSLYQSKIEKLDWFLMEVKQLTLEFFKMTILNLKYFMKKYILPDKTLNKLHLQKFYKHPIYPRASKIYSNERFVKVDNGSQGGTHWICS